MTPAPSRAFDRLDERVRRWIWEKGWDQLRDAQERAIDPILRGDQDVLIAAATAAGKTEAAFLPIASFLLTAHEPGLALYLSPLKALINDQALRLNDFFGRLDLPVYPWHGDVGAKPKENFEKQPRGALLITPESLEGLFVRKGFYLPHIFRYLRFVVLDEMHSFIGTERGIQVSSQLTRLEDALGRRVPRIGLSATLGDMNIARQYLRPHDPHSVCEIISQAGTLDLRILVKGYREAPTPGHNAEDDEHTRRFALHRIAEDLFAAMRGSKNLVFANSRGMVEDVVDRVSSIYESHHLPGEFHAHHGSLAKELREDVETLLKEPDRPATAVCTSTLEMGIDIGSVTSVAQLSPPFSVASLRQRLGRSGRRREPAILRAFVMELDADPQRDLHHRLRLDLAQTIACVELLLQRWCEPPASGALHLSTLIHQLLSLIAQKGGIRADDAFRALCRRGPFPLDAARFTTLLRALAAKKLIQQSEDGTLLHGEQGEKIVNHYTFYPTFWTSAEFRLLHDTRHLGNLSVSQPVAENSMILFGGRRWRVVTVQESTRVIGVVPAQGGRAPLFNGSGTGNVHARVHQEMIKVLSGTDVPVYLDHEAKSLLAEGRSLFNEHGLQSRRVVGVAGGTLVFLWAGDRVTNTVAMQLQSDGFTVENFGVGLQVARTEPLQVRQQLRSYLSQDPPNADRLAATVGNKLLEKYDEWLPPDLLAAGYGASLLTTAAAWQALAEILAIDPNPASHDR
jgi:ATP-dependent Lhr-like helicase